MSNPESRLYEDDFFIEPTVSSEDDRNWYPLKPIIIKASEAHSTGQVKFEKVNENTRRVRFSHPDLEKHVGKKTLTIEEDKLILGNIEAAFEDLEEPFSSLAEAGYVEGRPLFEWFNEIKTKYTEQKNALRQTGSVEEPDEGAYVWDPLSGALISYPRKELLRLALKASNSDLIDTLEGLLQWTEQQEQLSQVVVGFGGGSIGGNNFKAWVVTGCPEEAKIADADYLSIQNFNRIMGSDFLNYTYSEAMAKRTGTNRILKVDFHARVATLLYPYMKVDRYPAFLTEANIDDFLFGNIDEPGLDIFNEEVHDVLFKYESRKRIVDEIKNGTLDQMAVVTASDFGKTAHMSERIYSHDNLQISEFTSDEKLQDIYEQAYYGGKEEMFRLAGWIYGVRFGLKNSNEVPADAVGVVDLPTLEPKFSAWINGASRVPTASIPQLGGTAWQSAGKTAIRLAEIGLQLKAR